MARERQQPVVLFIHGFGSNASCWAPLLALLRGDPKVSSLYEFATWEYPTKWIELNLLGRIPELQEVGRALHDELDSPHYRDREVTLVGHSQGGLVIQAYFAFVLKKAEGKKLANIRQAILLATPCAGSTTARGLRMLFSTFFRNPQETTLRVLNSEVAEIRECVRERVVGATRDSEKAWRVPIHAFCGLEDGIVPEASARGVFDSVRSVNGTHSSIIRPPHREDGRYRELVELLLDPGGHSHRFEVERYENVIRVEPRIPPGSIRTRSEKNPREVRFDNYATLTRRVRFAPVNRCRDPFTINYDTRKEGYVVGHPSPGQPNEASSSERGRSDDTGRFYRFDFTPADREEYSVEVEIYHGFGAGECDVHFHPGLYQSRIRWLTYELDLSAYLAAGFTIAPVPACHVQSRDIEHSDLCRLRKGGQVWPLVAGTPAGVFRWEMSEVQHGVVDLVWDVHPPATTA